MEFMAFSWLLLYAAIPALFIILAILMVSYQKQIALAQRESVITQKQIARHLADIAACLATRQ